MFILVSEHFMLHSASLGRTLEISCNFHRDRDSKYKKKSIDKTFFRGRNTDTFFLKPRAFPFISIQGNPQDRIYVAFHSKELPDFLTSMKTLLDKHEPCYIKNKVKKLSCALYRESLNFWSGLSIKRTKVLISFCVEEDIFSLYSIIGLFATKYCVMLLNLCLCF